MCFCSFLMSSDQARGSGLRGAGAGGIADLTSQGGGPDISISDGRQQQAPAGARDQEPYPELPSVTPTTSPQKQRADGEAIFESPPRMNEPGQGSEEPLAEEEAAEEGMFEQQPQQQSEAVDDTVNQPVPEDNEHDLLEVVHEAYMLMAKSKDGRAQKS